MRLSFNIGPSELTLLDLNDSRANIANFAKQNGDGEPSTLAVPSAALIQSLVGAPSFSGATVTKETAMRCVTFLGGIKRLADDIAKMPLILYQRKMIKGRQRTTRAIDLPLYSILKDVPNPWATSGQMRWAMVMALLTNGNYYIQKIENALGISSLMFLNPWFVTQRWDFSQKDGQGNEIPTLYFDYQDGRIKKTFTIDQLWWGSILAANSISGQATITLAKEAIGILIASDSTAAKFYANGLNMAGFLTSANKDYEIDDIDAQKIVDRLRVQSRTNPGGFTYLPGAVAYEKMQFNPVESQLLQSRQWNAEEIIRLLGGAPLLVKMGYGATNSTYAASAAFLEDYFSTSLLPITTLLETTLVRDLVDPKDRGLIFAKHNADITLRGSPKERADTNEVLIKSGQRNPNELRDQDDLDPIDGWDKFFFPANSGVFDPETGEMFMPAQKTEKQPAAQPGLDEGATSEGTAPTPKVETLARFHAIVHSEAERCVRKESAQVTKLWAKSKDAVKDFYTDHVDFIVANLKITAEEAKTYCAGRLEMLNTLQPAELFKDLTGAVAALEALAIGDN